jgi:hypothetical protein
VRARTHRTKTIGEYKYAPRGSPQWDSGAVHATTWGMMQRQLFEDLSPVAARQPKTDPLILARFLKEAGESQLLDAAAIEEAHKILVRWADQETSGRLRQLSEIQLQGDFLNDVFCRALGYDRAVEGAAVWHLEQHHAIPGQMPDAVLGIFRQDQPRPPLAVIELKDARTHLDRDRSNGRTAVGQCWDYLVDTPRECRWGIVSNMVSFRLYERDSTKRVYEHFTLQSLRELRRFREFYALFHRKGLVEPTAGQPPRAALLLEKTRNRQRTVSDELYEAYSTTRHDLIAYLRFDLRREINDSIEMAQRLFDRVMFIAFCEDRELLPQGTIPQAYSVAGFQDVTNPRWQNFKNLFRFIDRGSERHGIDRYNGGLFQTHAVDDLELPDEPWTRFFNSISGYDFADEVNLEVLGHLFERSITELETLKSRDIFGDAERAERYATMPQSAKRKQLGIYYTPPELTSRIVHYTVDELIDKRFQELAVACGAPANDAGRGIFPDDERFWRGCLDILRNLKIVDPACGSGAFLFQAYNVLEQRYFEVVGHLEHLGADDAPDLFDEVPRFILNDNLYGVDLSPEAVEITQLALWIRSATKGQMLSTLSHNIVHGNSLVHDPSVDTAGFDWRDRFPEVFSGDCPLFSSQVDAPPASADREKGTVPLPTREPGFDCVIGNPPWERIKLQEREFFSLPAPEIATATNAAKRRQLVAKLEKSDPELFKSYQAAQRSSESLLDYCRTSGEYPLTGQGDINLYAVFAELASQLVAPHGRVGLLTPSGIASDKTTKDFFAAVAENNRLIRLYDFHNRKKIFQEVEGRLKFCILNFWGSSATHQNSDYVFFAEQVEDLDDPKRHVTLTANDIRLLNPNTRTCSIFRLQRDAEITKAVYRRFPVFIDRNRRGDTGNPWGIAFRRMFDQTNDAELFIEADSLKKDGFRLKGNRWVKGKRSCLPLYEAKMCRPYDHRHGTIYIKKGNWYMQGKTSLITSAGHQNPEELVHPRYWAAEEVIEQRLSGWHGHFLLGFRDVVRPTDERTLIAHFLPRVGVINTIPLILPDESISPERMACLIANLNAFALDYISRQKISQVHMNFFILEQLPVLSPDTYDKPCPWAPKTKLEKWISERVLKLTCTAEDMLPLAEACDFKSGSFKKEYAGRLNKWDEAERAELMAELDAAYFLLYGIDRDDAKYILSTFKGIHDPSPLFAGSTTTAEHILAVYDRLASSS